MYYVYMLRCIDGSLYTGSTDDLDRRYAMHTAGKGAKYTKRRPPVALAAAWKTETKSEALKLEYRIKQLKKEEKERIALGATFPWESSATRISEQ